MFCNSVHCLVVLAVFLGKSKPSFVKTSFPSLFHFIKQIPLTQKKFFPYSMPAMDCFGNLEHQKVFPCKAGEMQNQQQHAVGHPQDGNSRIISYRLGRLGNCFWHFFGRLIWIREVLRQKLVTMSSRLQKYNAIIKQYIYIQTSLTSFILTFIFIIRINTFYLSSPWHWVRFILFPSIPVLLSTKGSVLLSTKGSNSNILSLSICQSSVKNSCLEFSTWSLVISIAKHLPVPTHLNETCLKEELLWQLIGAKWNELKMGYP